MWQATCIFTLGVLPIFLILSSFTFSIRFYNILVVLLISDLSNDVWKYSFLDHARY